MKRFTLCIALLLFGNLLSAQARLGFTQEAIKSEFWESKYNVTSGYTDDGIDYLSLEVDDTVITHYFNDDNICKVSAIWPESQGALNYFVELYNKRYVIVSETEWKMYSENGIMTCKLLFPEDGDYCFIWSSSSD